MSLKTKHIPTLLFLIIVAVCSCAPVYPVQPFQPRIRPNPDKADRHYNIGIAHYILRHYDAAAAALDEAVSIDPLDYDAKICLGLSYAFLDSNSTAAAILDSEYPFSNARISNTEKGLALRITGHREEAIEAYYAALDADEPHPANLHSRIGINLFKLERYEDAIAEFKKVIDMNPTAAILYNSYEHLAHTYYQIGDYENAIEAFQAVITNNPEKKAVAVYNIANALYLLNRVDEAYQYYKKSIELDDKNIGAYYNLIIISIKTYKDVESAMNYFNKLNELDPNTAKKLFHLLSTLK